MQFCRALTWSAVYTPIEPRKGEEYTSSGLVISRGHVRDVTVLKNVNITALT